MDPANIPPEFKIEGPDWSATFNPGPSGPERANGQLPRQRNLGVHLMHTLLHERCVDRGDLLLRLCVALTSFTQCRLLCPILRRREVSRNRFQPDGTNI